jgi:fatty acid desaturase
MVAVVVAAAMGIAVAVGTATIHDLRTHGGSIPGGIFLFSLLEALAVGMYRQRYWAVVSFEGLLAFQMLVASLALVLASTIVAAAGCTLALLLGGWLFWTLIRVMGRLQATTLAAAESPSAQAAGGPAPEGYADAAMGDSCDRVA